jgi:hypothetical protein
VGGGAEKNKIIIIVDWELNPDLIITINKTKILRVSGRSFSTYLFVATIPRQQLG